MKESVRLSCCTVAGACSAREVRLPQGEGWRIEEHSKRLLGRWCRGAEIAALPKAAIPCLLSLNPRRSSFIQSGNQISHSLSALLKLLFLTSFHLKYRVQLFVPPSSFPSRDR